MQAGELAGKLHGLLVIDIVGRQGVMLACGRHDACVL